MFDAVLFDLDGTLLDIDVDEFLKQYFAALGPVLAQITGHDARSGLAALMAGTQAMCGSHVGTPNRAVFEAEFHRLTNVDLSAAEHAERIDAFYREAFPTLQGPRGPRPGAHDALAAAAGAGAVTVLATNPIFPLTAVRERMRWAGVDDHAFSLVTTYETCDACKPDVHYFQGIAGRLDLDPGRCLFVGDDPELDMPAAHAGMKTFYVGSAEFTGADWSGSLNDVATLLSGSEPA